MVSLQSITDPELIRELEESESLEVTDPKLLEELEGDTERDSSIINDVSRAVSSTPLGMASRGAGSVLNGLNRLVKPFIPVPRSAQTVAKGIFRPFRAAGVGTAEELKGRFTGQSPIKATRKTVEAFKPGYEPKTITEKVGATLGEAAPVVAATIASPSIGGPAAFAAMQAAQEGKVSPVPALMGGIPRMLGPLRNISRSGTRKTLSFVGDIPEESVQYKMEHPGKLRQDIVNIASKDVPNIANKFNRIIEGLNSSAKNVLSKSVFLNDGAVTKDEIFRAISLVRKELGGIYTPEAKSAANSLNKISNNLKKVKNTVSQNQVHNLIVDLDREIPWKKVWQSPETITMQDESLIGLRGRLDSILKSRNPEYKKIMGPLSEVIDNRNQFLKNFGVKRIKTQGFQPSDTTVPRLLGATKEERLATQRILRKTEELTGEKLAPKVREAQVKTDFEPETGRSFGVDKTGLRQTFGRPLVKKILEAGDPESVRIVRKYLKEAGGDKGKARQKALEEGYVISKRRK